MLSNTQTMLQIPYSAMDEDRKLNALLSMLQFRMEPIPRKTTPKVQRLQPADLAAPTRAARP